MRRTHFIISLLAGLLCLATVSCKDKEKVYYFGGEMEPISYGDDSKTYLGHAEQWIYWEQDDDIKVFLGDKAHSGRAEAVGGYGTLTARFSGGVPEPSGTPQIYAIYPYSSAVDGEDWTKLRFPATQPYRDGPSTYADSSFGRGAMPMVAWEEKGIDYTIFFHAVSGILRLQFYSTTEQTIQSIVFEEVSATPRQISGIFNVNDITENRPWLKGTDSATVANRKITITDINKTIGPAQNQFLTFYLPLPATGPDAKTHYKLKMTINAEGGKYCTKTLGADIHRRNITMMRALEITDWTNSPSDDPVVNLQLVGSGTKDRPFQIYNAKELKLVRDAFAASSNVKINGQTVVGVPASGNTDNATHFKIVRSDIELLNSTDYGNLTTAEQNNPDSKYVRWDAGIPNFKGYMYFASSTATNGGITNHSNAPLFESITSEGFVYRVYVKGTNTPTVLSSATYSPMCNTNNGTMLECHNKCAVTVGNTANLAGLCVTNNGKIEGGANEAQLTTNGNVSGICFTNNGVIQGNFTMSAAIPSGANVAGIAYNNNGTVMDCQVSSNTPVTSSGNWGIVVFNNHSGAVIDNCVSTGAIVYTINGSVGGICNVNSGIVKNCSNRIEIRASQGNVGGIVGTMNHADAEVYNCCTTTPFIHGAIDLSSADNCGGVVGQLLKGKVFNCYNASSVTGATNSGGLIGNLANDEDADVQGCWSAQGHMFVGLYDAGAHVGVYCFSATIAETSCNRIYNASSAPAGHYAYEIFFMHEDQTINGTVTPLNFIGQHCGVALNAWRNAQPNPDKYYAWTTTVGQKPVFVTGLVSK